MKMILEMEPGRNLRWYRCTQEVFAEEDTRNKRILNIIFLPEVWLPLVT